MFDVTTRKISAGKQRKLVSYDSISFQKKTTLMLRMQVEFQDYQHTL
jgi:hypothetical protein